MLTCSAAKNGMDQGGGGGGREALFGGKKEDLSKKGNFSLAPSHPFSVGITKVPAPTAPPASPGEAPAQLESWGFTRPRSPPYLGRGPASPPKHQGTFFSIAIETVLAAEG